MSTLIVYATNHGTTQSIAEDIGNHLKGKVNYIDLKENQKLDLNPYELIIIGGSIHAGQIQKRVRKFCESNLSLLLQKRIGLFLCCMDENRASEQLESAFQEILRSHAITCQALGGEFRLEKMNFLEKAIVKKVAGVTESVNNIKAEKIEKFVQEIQQAS